MRIRRSEFREKPWGRVATILSTPDSLIEYLEINAGGQSSEHLHHRHWNRFIVFEGLLEIRIPESVTITIGPGETADIPPGIWHQFHCREAAKVVECYYQEQAPKSVEDDIERR